MELRFVRGSRCHTGKSSGRVPSGTDRSLLSLTRGTCVTASTDSSGDSPLPLQRNTQGARPTAVGGFPLPSAASLALSPQTQRRSRSPLHSTAVWCVAACAVAWTSDWHQLVAFDSCVWAGGTDPSRQWLPHTSCRTCLPTPTYVCPKPCPDVPTRSSVIRTLQPAAICFRAQP